MKTRPRIIQTYRLLICTCFTNATQITGPRTAWGTCTVTCISYYIDVRNAQRCLGMHRFVLGYLPRWFVLWFLFVLPIGAAEQTWSQILFSTLQSVCFRLSLLLSGLLFMPLSRLRWITTQVGKSILNGILTLVCYWMNTLVDKANCCSPPRN